MAYDALGRITTTTTSAGTTTNAYADWKMTITDAGGKTKDLVKDAYGNLVEVDEHNGSSIYTTRYTFNYLGNLLSLSDALGNVRNFTYDGIGRRLTAQDLHAPGDTTFGTWTYSYDDAGNLIQSINPNGQTVNYTYDNINRQFTEDFVGQGGVEVTYSYDSGIDGKGHLTGIISTAINQTNTYDALGLIKQESKSFGGPPYQTNYDYNRQGDQTLITNPDGSQIQYLYNSAGLLDSVQRKESTDSSFANVASFHYSPTEQVATTTYANGQVTTNTYDATKLYRLTSKVTTIAAGSHAQNLAYTYDPVGNILQIVDNSATSTKKTVNYGYDDLYRLTSATATGVAAGQQPYSQTYAYDAIGNLTSKSDQGNYTYAGNQGTSYANPHAVTSISSGGTSTELLTSPWHLSGNNGSAEAYQSVDPNILNSKSSITVTYDLHGLCALGGDASALVIDQPGSWGTYVSLSNYGQNCHNGPQTITIPLSDFPGLNTNQPLGFNGSFHVRFWYGSAFTVDITSLKINAAPRITDYPSKFYNTDWITPVKHILAGSVEVATITGSGSSAVVHYIATDHLISSNIVTNSNDISDEIVDYLPLGTIRIDQKAGAFSEQRKFTSLEYDVDVGLRST